MVVVEIFQSFDLLNGRDSVIRSGYLGHGYGAIQVMNRRRMEPGQIIVQFENRHPIGFSEAGRQRVLRRNRGFEVVA